jgi:predicted HD phosphohydrolase
MASDHHGRMTRTDVLSLFDHKGDIAYDGEGISQLAHAWQCGQLALMAGASPALQLASWLHDLGHLLSTLPGTPTLHGLDDRHEATGAACLRPLWGDAVAEPVRLHVDAKRYRVSKQPQYLASLSEDSRRSLALQGGPMRDAQCLAFEANLYFLDAQRVRTWDDLGKRPDGFAVSRAAALQTLHALMLQVPGA